MDAKGFGPFSLSDVKHAFAAFDLDKNSFVGAAELRSVYSALGEEVTDDEIDEMIRMVDTDGDGQVSEGEFAKMIFRYAQQIPDKDQANPPAAGAAGAAGAGAGGKKSARKHRHGATSGTPSPRKPKSGAADDAKAGVLPTGGSSAAATATGTGTGLGGLNLTAAAGEPATATGAGAAAGGTVTGAKLAEKKTDLRGVMSSLNIGTEQIKKLMADFQASATDGKAAAAAGADGKAAGADTKRTRYLLNFERFCKLLGLDHTTAGGNGSTTATAAGAGTAAGGSGGANSSFAAERMFALFDHDGSGLIDAKEFLIGLSAYADATKDDKIKFAFSLYDEDGSGKISMSELIKIMKAIYMASNPAQVQKKAEQIMAHGDKDKDGTLSFEEFAMCAKSFPNLLFPVMAVTKKVDAVING